MAENFGHLSPHGSSGFSQSIIKMAYQEGEVNTSDLADPMIMAIMTSRRKKRANAKIFENGVVVSR